MRCTRCDGFAVPQAVGIASDGRVVFGWCLDCLAETDCRLVEVTASRPGDLRLNFAVQEADRRGGEPRPGSAHLDQSQWLVAAVATLLMSWGLVLMAGAIFIDPRSFQEHGPLGHGFPILLQVGGAFTTAVGLILMILGAHRQWFPGTFAFSLLSWITFLVGMGILVLGIIDYQPRRNVPLVLTAGAAGLISMIARWLERSQSRREKLGLHLVPRKPATSAQRPRAGGPRRLG